MAGPWMKFVQMYFLLKTGIFASYFSPRFGSSLGVSLGRIERRAGSAGFQARLGLREFSWHDVSGQILYIATQNLAGVSEFHPPVVYTFGDVFSIEHGGISLLFAKYGHKVGIFRFMFPLGLGENVHQIRWLLMSWKLPDLFWLYVMVWNEMVRVNVGVLNLPFQKKSSLHFVIELCDRVLSCLRGCQVYVVLCVCFFSRI